jgi:CheY-like chemotaxis protein
LFETKIQEKNLELIKIYDPKIPEVLVGDPVRLHQIILNLLSNAVKFTQNGKIIVNVKMIEEDARKVIIEFSIRDTGIGIAKSKLPNIFDNFQQATSSTSRLFGGTGLGLAIVKKLVENQNGTIKVDSKINEGSNFSFNLPILKTKEMAEMESEVEVLDKENKNIKILVVEDIALNQLLMKTLLDDFGFEREIAENGKIAIERLEIKKFDIILMDLQMPEMNGFEATEYIRKIMKSDIPIIALTADVTTVDLAKCKAVGMNDYIAKPIDERVLYSKIISLVKKSTKLNSENMEVNRNNHENKTVKVKNIDLAYLSKRTKSNSILMIEMIELYLEQTLSLIVKMRESFINQDWDLLKSVVHKMIPSFSIVGIHSDYEEMAKRIQAFVYKIEEIDEVSLLISRLEEVCSEACLELEEEIKILKSK